MMKLSASPSPRYRERRYHPFDFPIVAARRLPKPPSRKMDFTEVLGSRRSNRTFLRPLNDLQLSLLFWHTCRKIQSECELSGFTWQHRGVPSAGGRHPIHSMVIQQVGRSISPALYIPEDHRLATLQVPNLQLQKLIKMCNQIMDVRRATIIWFLAEIPRTASKYTNAESLIWRDAGAILAYLNLVACAAKMSFCAIGSTGEPFISRMLCGKDTVCGVGGCAVGFPTH